MRLNDTSGHLAVYPNGGRIPGKNAVHDVRLPDIPPFSRITFFSCAKIRLLKFRPKFSFAFTRQLCAGLPTHCVRLLDGVRGVAVFSLSRLGAHFLELDAY